MIGSLPFHNRGRGGGNETPPRKGGSFSKRKRDLSGPCMGSAYKCRRKTETFLLIRNTSSCLTRRRDQVSDGGGDQSYLQ